MNIKRLSRLLFFTLVLLQFQANAQANVFSNGLTIIASASTGHPNADELLTPATLYNIGTVTVTGDLVLQPGTTLTVSGTSLTVSGKVDLQEDVPNGKSFLYLRNGGQLIQTDPASQNTGTGVLSVYQEGTVSNYQGNYWCSPVGDASGTGNGKFGITMLGRPSDITTTTVAVPILPTDPNPYDGVSNPLKISSYWINTFSPSNPGNSGYADWHHEYAGTTIPPGIGFSMKGSSTADLTIADSNDLTTAYGGGIQNNPDGFHQRYDFRGRPNNGDILIPLKYDIVNNNGLFTLTGNPYPSAIDLDLFFNDTDLVYDNVLAMDGFAYFWEQDKTVNSHNITAYKGGYGVYVPSTYDINGVNQGDGGYVPAVFFSYNGDGSVKANLSATGGNYNRRYAPIGQGFMIKSFGAGLTVARMRNSYRVFQQEKEKSLSNTSEFAKNVNNAKAVVGSQIRFNTALDNGPISQMLVLFRPGSTEGFDKGQDASNPNTYPTQVNFLVGNKRCVVNSVPFDINRKLPLIFDNTAQANYKITVNEIVNLDAVSNVYLHDITADQYYDIKNNFYDLTLPAGMNYTQYEVTFQNPKLGVNDLTEKSFDIFQDNAASKLIVSNPLQKELAACELYDIAGKSIFSKKHLGAQSSYEFSTAELSDGIYIVRVTSQENKTKAQKIVVRH